MHMSHPLQDFWSAGVGRRSAVGGETNEVGWQVHGSLDAHESHTT